MYHIKEDENFMNCHLLFCFIDRLVELKRVEESMHIEFNGFILKPLQNTIWCNII